MTDTDLKLRGTILILDERPDLRWPVYKAWQEAGATVEIETVPLEILTSIPRGAYFAVVVPLSAAGQISVPDAFVGLSIESWAARHAPSYAKRFLYYGSASQIAALHLPEDQPKPLLLELSPLPGKSDIRRAMDVMERFVKRLKGAKGSNDSNGEKPSSS